MPLSMIDEAFNLGDIFSFLFDGISISTCCKRVITMTLSLILLAPRTSLVVLIFLASLILVRKRLLVLATRYVNGRSVS